jgi:DNA-binding IclR family transcriptional regulator
MSGTIGGDDMTTTADDGGRETGTRSLEKALRLLRETAAFDMQGARLTDLVSRTGLGPATAHRMLKCLVDLGFLAKDPRSRYHLGRQVFELGLLAAHRFDSRAVAEGPLTRLAETTGDVAFLMMRNGLDTVCLERREGRFPIKVLSMAPGMRRPLGFGAGGVAILAAMPPAEAEAVLVANEHRLRTFGPGVPVRVRRAVDAARATGHAVSESHLTGGITGVALVVPTDGPVPHLAVSVVAIEDRLREDRRPDALAALVRAAKDVATAVRATEEG